MYSINFIFKYQGQGQISRVLSINYSFGFYGTEDLYFTYCKNDILTALLISKQIVVFFQKKGHLNILNQPL
jgi:hypothetical protein